MIDIPLLSDNEISQMVEYLMRETIDFEKIITEPVFQNIDRNKVKSEYLKILHFLVKNHKEKEMSELKDKIFQIVKHYKPINDEEISYLITSHRESMTILGRFKEEFLNDYWDMKYREPVTGLEMTFGEWSNLFQKHGTF